MKNFKKILACVMAVATLGSVSLLPINADASANDTSSNNYGYDSVSIVVNDEYDINNDIIAFIVDDEYVSNEPQVYLWNNDTNKVDLNNSLDLSTCDVVINVSQENIPLIRSNNADIMYDYTHHTWLYCSQAGNMLGESDITIGESDTTIRGDVNLDGKVSTADLLYLKKYLLGLIKW